MIQYKLILSHDLNKKFEDILVRQKRVNKQLLTIFLLLLIICA